MTRSALGAVAGCAAALALAGCQKKPPEIVPVSGVVLLNGQPLPHAVVTFTPMIQGFGAEYIATGVTDEKGRFRVACPGKDGAAAGENRVTVEDAPGPEGTRGPGGEAQAAAARYAEGLKNRPIPPAYQSVARTPLAVTVAAGQGEYTLELKR
jgi:hypothetical protein